jgi:signal transduction histidine kinase
MVFLVGGGLFPVRASRRRSSFHLRNSTAMAAFFVLGLESLWLVLPAAGASILLIFLSALVRGRSLVRRLVLPSWETAGSASARLARDTVFLVTGLLASGWVYGHVGRGIFPLPLASLRDLLAFMVTSTTAAVAIASLNEVYYRLFSDPVLEATAVPKELAFLPSDAPLYRLMLISGSPLQILAQVFYLSYGPPGLLFALGWFALAIALHGALLKERLRLHQAFRELEASQRALAVQDLTGRIVHQTRHQLGLIGISTHLIREALKGTPPERAKVLTQLDRLEGVATDLRRMLSEELGPPRAEEAPGEGPEVGGERRALALRELVNEEAERLRGKADQLGLTLTVQAETAGLVAGRLADAEQLGQGLFNVLENALAAARSTVSVELKEEAGSVVLTVLDDGPGIPPDILARAAEPFVTTKEEGSGMGLFIADAAARRCGGGLILENLPRGGLRATFRLPAVTPPRPADLVKASSARRAEGT